MCMRRLLVSGPSLWDNGMFIDPFVWQRSSAHNTSRQLGWSQKGILGVFCSIEHSALDARLHTHMDRKCRSNRVRDG